MGFLKRAISNGISEGISKGINKAVGDAVNKAVAPAADKWAGRVAQSIDESAAAMDEVSRAAEQAPTTVGEGAGFASLTASLARMQQDAESYANELSKNLKECPECGEMASADKLFCPQCGAKLPEKTVGELHICEKCGMENTVGTRFCQSCGEVLPVYRAEYEAEQAEKRAMEEAEKQAAEEAKRRAEEAAARDANPFGALKGIKIPDNLKEMAEDKGGAAVDKAFGAASSLFGKFKK